MNTGQTMLTVAALTLLTVITLRYFASVGQSGENLSVTNSGLTATTIATSYIERAQGTAFDHGTSEDQEVSLDSVQKHYDIILTAPGSLGAETAGEMMSPDSANDFDDFAYFGASNPFVYIPVGINETFKVEFKVYYVDTNNVNASVGVNYRTFVKKMDIKVYRVVEDTVKVVSVDMSAISGFFRP